MLEFTFAGDLNDRLSLSGVAVADDGDPVMPYLTFLCARQLATVVEETYPDFWAEQAEGVRRLTARLARFEAVRAKVLAAPTPTGREGVTEAFLGWYETMFAEDMTPPDLDEDEA